MKGYGRGGKSSSAHSEECKSMEMSGQLCALAAKPLLNKLLVPSEEARLVILGK